MANKSSPGQLQVTDVANHGQGERAARELDFFESLDRVNRAMHGTNDLEQMMRDVLDAVLSILGCDRAFLLDACDPDAAAWEVPMERTHPSYPGVFELGRPVQTTAPIQALFRALLASDTPVELSLGQQIDPEVEPWKTFGIKSVLAMALYPKTGKPWQFGVHQCAYARVWTAREKQLFQEIGRRLADGLTTLLMYRDLRRSEDLLENIFEHIPNLVLVKDAATLTRRREIDERLRPGQKSEPIGQLVDSVAHDFNNMLGVIIGNTDIALADVEVGRPLYKLLQDIRHAAERSAELTRQLLAFARNSKA